jgi:hypothetical protein
VAIHFKVKNWDPPGRLFALLTRLNIDCPCEEYVSKYGSSGSFQKYEDTLSNTVRAPELQ